MSLPPISATKKENDIPTTSIRRCDRVSFLRDIGYFILPLVFRLWKVYWRSSGLRCVLEDLKDDVETQKGRSTYAGPRWARFVIMTDPRAGYLDESCHKVLSSRHRRQASCTR